MTSGSDKKSEETSEKDCLGKEQSYNYCVELLLVPYQKC